MCVTDIQQRDDKKGEDEVEAWPQIGLTPSDSTPFFPIEGFHNTQTAAAQEKRDVPREEARKSYREYFVEEFTPT